MDAFVMDMYGYGIEPGNAAEEYGDEVMSAGWNPQLMLVSESFVSQANRHVDLHPDLATVDVDAFLKKMYEYQR